MKRIVLLAALALSAMGAAADEPFNGLVTHPDGRGIKARVSVVGRDKQTMADGKGRFGFTDIEPDDTLQFVFKRDTLRVALEGRRSVNVVWTVGSDLYTAHEDEELVNFGFGYVKRRESTDYTSGISGDRLRATGCMSVTEAIMVCYPGLKMIGGELCLRTQNSINGSSAVLVLCDGMEVNPDMINIHDVKSVEVLKGSNMYGFRGVNGVVLITTMNAVDALKVKMW